MIASASQTQLSSVKCIILPNERWACTNVVVASAGTGELHCHWLTNCFFTIYKAHLGGIQSNQQSKKKNRIKLKFDVIWIKSKEDITFWIFVILNKTFLEQSMWMEMSELMSSPHNFPCIFNIYKMLKNFFFFTQTCNFLACPHIKIYIGANILHLFRVDYKVSFTFS